MAKKFKILIVFSLFFLYLPFFAKAQPTAISDLQCFFAQMPGSVWLTWTAPAGANSYDVRYFPSAFLPANYDIVWQYSQTWSGTAWSGTAQQGLVTNLTGNKTWFFAMKAIDGSNNYSDISNIVSCFVPTVTVQTDKTAPTSLITDPKDGATILVNETYIIKGDSSDTGGSSVRQVEISFDEGANWLKAEAVEGNKNNGFSWKFIWSKPAAGDYQLITRATDWVGNVETPSSGIKVIVKELEAEKPPTEKPISQMTAEELKTKIAKIQQQIIQLLTQLIQLIQSQISQLKK